MKVANNEGEPLLSETRNTFCVTTYLPIAVRLTLVSQHFAATSISDNNFSPEMSSFESRDLKNPQCMVSYRWSITLQP